MLMGVRVLDNKHSWPRHALDASADDQRPVLLTTNPSGQAIFWPIPLRERSLDTFHLDEVTAVKIGLNGEFGIIMNRSSNKNDPDAPSFTHRMTLQILAEHRGSRDLFREADLEGLPADAAATNKQLNLLCRNLLTFGCLHFNYVRPPPPPAPPAAAPVASPQQQQQQQPGVGDDISAPRSGSRRGSDHGGDQQARALPGGATDAVSSPSYPQGQFGAFGSEQSMAAFNNAPAAQFSPSGAFIPPGSGRVAPGGGERTGDDALLATSHSQQYARTQALPRVRVPGRNREYLSLMHLCYANYVKVVQFSLPPSMAKTPTGAPHPLMLYTMQPLLFTIAPTGNATFWRPMTDTPLWGFSCLHDVEAAHFRRGGLISLLVRPYGGRSPPQKLTLQPLLYRDDIGDPQDPDEIRCVEADPMLANERDELIRACKSLMETVHLLAPNVNFKVDRPDSSRATSHASSTPRGNSVNSPDHNNNSQQQQRALPSDPNTQVAPGQGRTSEAGFSAAAVADGQPYSFNPNSVSAAAAAGHGDDIAPPAGGYGPMPGSYGGYGAGGALPGYEHLPPPPSAAAAPAAALKAAPSGGYGDVSNAPGAAAGGSGGYYDEAAAAGQPVAGKSRQIAAGAAAPPVDVAGAAAGPQKYHADDVSQAETPRDKRHPPSHDGLGDSEGRDTKPSSSSNNNNKRSGDRDRRGGGDRDRDRDDYYDDDRDRSPSSYTGDSQGYTTEESRDRPSRGNNNNRRRQPSYSTDSYSQRSDDYDDDESRHRGGGGGRHHDDRRRDDRRRDDDRDRRRDDDRHDRDRRRDDHRDDRRRDDHRGDDRRPRGDVHYGGGGGNRGGRHHQYQDPRSVTPSESMAPSQQSNGRSREVGQAMAAALRGIPQVHAHTAAPVEPELPAHVDGTKILAETDWRSIIMRDPITAATLMVDSQQQWEMERAAIAHELLRMHEERTVLLNQNDQLHNQINEVLDGRGQVTGDLQALAKQCFALQQQLQAERKIRQQAIDDNVYKTERFFESALNQQTEECDVLKERLRRLEGVLERVGDAAGSSPKFATMSGGLGGAGASNMSANAAAIAAPPGMHLGSAGPFSPSAIGYAPAGAAAALSAGRVVYPPGTTSGPLSLLPGVSPPRSARGLNNVTSPAGVAAIAAAATAGPGGAYFGGASPPKPAGVPQLSSPYASPQSRAHLAGRTPQDQQSLRYSLMMDT
jgi:hypothetical protein